MFENKRKYSVYGARNRCLLSRILTNIFKIDMKYLCFQFLDERKYFAYINFSRMVSLQKLNCLSSHSLSLST